MEAYHEIMTAEEVAEYLRVAERTVYDWAQKGEIPCGKLGATWRFRRTDIDEWLNGKLRRSPRPESARVDIAPLLPEERILFLPGGNKAAVLDALIDTLSGLPEVEKASELRNGILRRESLMSTGVGLGVGVPHVRLNTIRNIVMAAALCAEPISEYESVDGQPVRLVFMIGAHTSQHAQYLRLLAYLSGKLKDNPFRERLLAAPSPAEFRTLLLDGKGES